MVAFTLAVVAFAKVTRLERSLKYYMGGSNLQVYTLQKWIIAWLSLQVAVDMIISSVLAYTLVKSRTGFDASDTVINRLVRTTIQSGILCGLFSILALVMFLAKPYTQLYAVAGYPIGRLYTNAVMDSLLSRKFVRGILGHGNETRVLGSGFKLQVRKDVDTEIRFNGTLSGRETVDTKTQEEQYSKTTA
ncbi:unnamed protein product [Cyclocybe aegerita]|uniref:DUF6534 domain-containing protein n=1 Tax=Cyclocybe aegerita TaxID=1973307 RepID=A0A8S0XJL6_CYCAE|nr:unnamed protein product [Cyclocybe aegerita]